MHGIQNRPRRTRHLVVRAAFLLMIGAGGASFAQEPDVGGNLALLKPLLGTWEGRFERGGGEGVVLQMTCELILDGNAVRVRNLAAGMVRENLYYWNPSRGRLEFLVLTNNGQIGSGTVASEAGLIVETGEQITPSGATRITRGTWEPRPDGSLVVRGSTQLDGEWRPGHVIVFEQSSSQ